MKNKPLKKPVAKDMAARNKADNKLEERCEILARMIRAIAPIYHHKSSSANQRQLVETMIGAAIWYFPQGPELWTRMISLEAIQSFHPKERKVPPKLTAEHQYPRKIAATELLHLDWENDGQSGQTLLELYRSRYGRYNFVTPQENKRLVTYQKKEVFKGPEKAYRDAGITLVSLSLEELAIVKKRKRAFIEKYQALES
jgi:hypothetical protein